MICSGKGCSVTFSDVTFENCCLLVLSGAHATLDNTRFKNEHCTTDQDSHIGPGISVVCHGVNTKVGMTGVHVNGGEVGVAVRAGAQLQAENLVIEQVSVSAMQTHDEGSSLSVTSATIKNMVSLRKTRASLKWSTHAVLVSRGSFAALTQVRVEASDLGVVVDNSHARLKDCSVTGTLKSCAQFRGGATGEVCQTHLCGSRSGVGLHVRGWGTTVEVDGCTIQDNAQQSIAVADDAEVEVKATVSEGNMGRAALRATTGAKLTVSNSSSRRDRNPGAVEHRSGGTVVISDVNVNGVNMSGVFTDNSNHGQ